MERLILKEKTIEKLGHRCKNIYMGEDTERFIIEIEAEENEEI
jgi:hypothetical protein